MTNISSGNVGRKIAIGAGWTVAMRSADRVIGLVSIAFLARLLLPEDFGLVAYAMSFYAILEVFLQFGFETVIIRDQDADDDKYNTAWTLNILKGVLAAAVIFASAESVAAFFNEPELVVILHFVALVPLIQGFENIGIVNFIKYMNFDKDFYFNSSVRLVSTIVTISLAFYFRSYWALVIGTLCRSILSLILSYVMNAYRPRFSLRAFSRVFGFSKWILFQNIFYASNNRLPVFVLGRFFPAEVVGFYNLAVELSMLASAELAAPIRRALFPGLAGIAGDKEKMTSIVNSTISIIAFLGLPISVGIAVCAPLIVPIVFGDNWLPIAPLIQVLCVNAIVMVLYSNSHLVYLAADKPHITTYIEAVRVALMVPLLLVLAPEYGAIGAAWSIALVGIIIFFIDYAVLKLIADLSLISIVHRVWRSVVAVALMWLAVDSAVDYMQRLTEFPMILQLVCAVTLGAVTYMGAVFALWLTFGRPDHAESFLLQQAKPILQKLSRGTAGPA